MTNGVMAFVVVTAAAAVASAVNAVAGGGMLVAFPILVALGVQPLSANATSTVGLFLGSLGGAAAYRRSMSGMGALQRRLIIASAVGGTLGAILLTRTSDRVFAQLVPWLILFATVLFAVGPRFVRDDLEYSAASTVPLRPAFFALQIAVGVYGGYFGAGAGFVVLAMLQSMGIRDIHAMNGLKLVAGLGMNAAAIVVFVASGLVDWHLAIAMMIGALAGGQITAHNAQRLHPGVVRRIVVAFGVVSALWLFARR